MEGKMEECMRWWGQSESQVGREGKQQTCWCCRDQQRTWRMAQASAEQLILGQLKRKSGHRKREHLASTQEPPLPKGKETEPSVESIRS